MRMVENDKRLSLGGVLGTHDCDRDVSGAEETVRVPSGGEESNLAEAANRGRGVDAIR